MRTLIITDIHANLPALEAVLQAAGHWDEVLFLGDVLGAGPHPAECVRVLRELNPVAVMGNHDRYLSDAGSNVSDVWDIWTKKQLSEDEMAYVHAFPQTAMYHDILLTHHGFKHIPVRPAITPGEMAAAFPDLSASAVWFGHYHHLIQRQWEGKSYICFRSVGQSRDGNPDAGFAIWENGLLFHCSVPYDAERTAYALERLPMEPASVTRWQTFVRTGYDEEWSRLR